MKAYCYEDAQAFVSEPQKETVIESHFSPTFFLQWHPST
jgi:hypothetical protein